MRIPIVYEGRSFGDGRIFIADGALALPDKPVPVSLYGPDGESVVGKATEFERNADGSIWATINLVPEITVTEITVEDDRRTVTSGRIAEVILVRHEEAR